MEPQEMILALRDFLLDNNASRNVIIPFRPDKRPIAAYSNDAWQWPQFEAFVDRNETDEEHPLVTGTQHWGVLLYDLCVVDFDARDACDSWLRDFPEDFSTGPCETTRKGLHYYFRRPRLFDDLGIYRTIGIGDKTDLLTITSTGTPGTVCCAPSPDKTWVRAPWDCGLHDMSSALANHIKNTVLTMASGSRTKQQQASGASTSMGGGGGVLGKRARAEVDGSQQLMVAADDPRIVALTSPTGGGFVGGVTRTWPKDGGAIEFDAASHRCTSRPCPCCGGVHDKNQWILRVMRDASCELLVVRNFSSECFVPRVASIGGRDPVSAFGSRFLAIVREAAAPAVGADPTHLPDIDHVSWMGRDTFRFHITGSKCHVDLCMRGMTLGVVAGGRVLPCRSAVAACESPSLGGDVLMVERVQTCKRFFAWPSVLQDAGRGGKVVAAVQIVPDCTDTSCDGAGSFSTDVIIAGPGHPLDVTRVVFNKERNGKGASREITKKDDMTTIRHWVHQQIAVHAVLTLGFPARLLPRDLTPSGSEFVADDEDDVESAQSLVADTTGNGDGMRNACVGMISGINYGFAATSGVASLSNKKAKVDFEFAHFLCESGLEDDFTALPEEGGKTYYLYRDERGVWNTTSREEVASYISGRVDMAYRNPVLVGGNLNAYRALSDADREYLLSESGPRKVLGSICSRTFNRARDMHMDRVMGVAQRGWAPFDNGYLDASARTVRPFKRRDFITDTLGYDFVPRNEIPAEDFAYVEKYYATIFPDKTERETFMRCIGAAFFGAGGSEDKTFVVLSDMREGNNGKSCLLMFVTMTFGALAAPTQSNFLYVSSHNDPNGHSANDLSYVGKRLAAFDETDATKKLDVRKIKALVNEFGVINGREAHKNKVRSHRWTAFVIIACNQSNFPNVTSGDAAFFNRMVAIPMRAKFVRTAAEANRDTHTYQIESQLMDRLRKCVPAHVHLLMDAFQRYEAAGGLGRIPDSCNEFRASIMEDADPRLDLVRGYIEENIVAVPAAAPAAAATTDAPAPSPEDAAPQPVTVRHPHALRAYVDIRNVVQRCMQYRQMTPLGQTCNFKNSNDVKLVIVRVMAEQGYTIQRIQPKVSEGGSARQQNIQGFKGVRFVNDDQVVCSKYT